MKNSISYFFYIFIASIMITGCGLPSQETVNAPSVLVTGDTTTIGLTAPVIDDFIDGYEIYYKIYKAGDSSIQSDLEQFDTTGNDYSYEFGDLKLTDLKFHRLNFGNTENLRMPSYPMISSNLSDPINLQAGENVIISISSQNITVDGDSIGIPLRAVIDSNTEFHKTFTDNVISGDADNNGVVSGEPAYSVSFAVYSYASVILKDYQNSYPVHLGTIIDIPN